MPCEPMYEVPGSRLRELNDAIAKLEAERDALREQLAASVQEQTIRMLNDANAGLAERIQEVLAERDALREQVIALQASSKATDGDWRLRLRNCAAERDALRTALQGLAYDAPVPCWCEVATGNPMVRDHSPACKQARDALAAGEDA